MFRDTVLRIAGLAALAGALAACNGDNNSVVPVPRTTVVTFKDSTFDFTTLRTFSMPDTVVQLAPSAGVPLDVTREFDATILSQVRQNFRARGFIEDADPRNVKPDIIVLVGVTATPNYNAFIGYPWFAVWGFYTGWGFFPGFTPAWGIVYPWFPVVGTTAYDRGTLIIDLIPTSEVDPATQTIRSAWTGVAAGVLNLPNPNDRVIEAINEMFAQSPYLTAPPTANR